MSMTPDCDSSKSKLIQAVELRRLGRPEFQNLKQSGGLSASQLPTTWLDRGALNPDEVAVVSWRWDVRVANEPSINLAAAVCAALQVGIRYLLLDVVSVSQDQDKKKLISDVVELGSLFSRLPVFAAYDYVGSAAWLPTMRRPWLFFEGRAFHCNYSKITYVSHEPGQGGEENFGFCDMLERVWETNYTTTILLVLAGRVGIGEVRDVAYIVPYHLDSLTSAYEQLSRNDFLLTAAILCQVFYEDGRFHAGSDYSSLDLCGMKFDRYAFTPATGDDSAYEYFDIVFDGFNVARYHKRTKPDRFTSEPVYVRYLNATIAGGERILQVLSPQSLARYGSQEQEIRASFSLADRPRGNGDKSLNIEVVRFYPKSQ